MVLVSLLKSLGCVLEQKKNYSPMSVCQLGWVLSLIYDTI